MYSKRSAAKCAYSSTRRYCCTLATSSYSIAGNDSLDPDTVDPASVVLSANPCQTDDRDYEFLSSRVLFLVAHERTVDLEPVIDDCKVAASISQVSQSRITRCGVMIR